MSYSTAWTKAKSHVIGRRCAARMLRLALLPAALVACLGLAPVEANAQSNQTSPLGIELNGVNYYSTEQPFLNVFKNASGWLTQVTYTTWDTGEEQYLQLDSNGWVTSLAGKNGQAVTFNQVGMLIQAAFGSPYYPSGQYVVLYDGTGTITYGMDAVKNTSLSAPGRDVLDVTPSGSGFTIMITATDPNNTGDYIRNIQVVFAANETLLDSGQIFSPTFISRVSGFRSLRFMDWMNTNNSTQSAWSSRLTPSYGYYGLGGGVPVEVMAALANKLGADAWFNMPHLATDDYVTQFATLVHQQLGSTQKAYVEYSNETWNYVFGQTTWMQSQGLALWPSAPSPFDANRSYYGMRAAQVCDIWKSVWGADANRVVCVMAAQAANTYTATQSLSCPLWSGGPCSAHGFSAVAIAPYFGYDVPDAWTTQADGGLTSLFTEITQGGLAPGGYPGGMIKQALDWVTSYKAVASSSGLNLIAYEGGQGLVNSNDAALSTLYVAANRDARMGAAYSTYLQGWKNAGGNLFSDFADISAYGKWGSWGALENVLQTSSPKYNALTAFITANPCWWSGCSSTPPPPPPNTTPPTVPTGLSGTAVSPTQINLSWTASTDNVGVTGYNVFRNSSKVVTSTTTSYKDTSVSPGTTYTYTVSAYDAAGNTSAQSSAVSITTPAPPKVSVNSPSNGATLKNKSVSIASSASDPSGIASIVITGDGNHLQTCTNTTACAATWHNVPQGTHAIAATAVNGKGLQAAASITILDLQ